MNILLLNGPNLNLLGKREPELYGSTSLSEVELNLKEIAASRDCLLSHLQTNAEHELINAIHQAKENEVDAIIINPAAFSHTSIAIRDALLGVAIPFYEVHITDIYSREKFRHFSYISDVAEKVFCGLGVKGYEQALDEAILKFKGV
jgi:3-dehydroquinate dehydratase-2